MVNIKKQERKINMLDEVNRFIENQKNKSFSSGNFDSDINSQLLNRLDIIIQLLIDIKNKQFNIIGTENGSILKSKKDDKPFMPSISSSGNIHATDLQKRTKKIDLKGSIDKLNQINK